MDTLDFACGEDCNDPDCSLTSAQPNIVAACMLVALDIEAGPLHQRAGLAPGPCGTFKLVDKQPQPTQKHLIPQVLDVESPNKMI